MKSEKKKPDEHDWIGKYCSFIKKEHVAEFEKKPFRTEADKKGWVLRGDIIEMEPAEPVGEIRTYICKVKGRRSGSILNVNSTLQYLRIIEEDQQ